MELSHRRNTAVRASRCTRAGPASLVWRGNKRLRNSTMRKILGTVLFAVSLMGGATVVLAQSSRNLTPVTGTEANLRAQFGGFRHSFRHRRHAVHASARPRRVARWERRPVASTPRPEVGTPPPPTNLPPQPSASPEQTAAIFWPDAAADLADYVLFADGKERFWTYGYDSIMHAAFTAADSGDPRGMHGRPGADRLSGASSQAKTPLASSDLCRAASASADALIERIERAVGPNVSQRDALEQLRRALAQAIERIATACPAAMPTTVAERLKAIQDRIWAMHDALLTIRLPFETFYNSLTDECGSACGAGSWNRPGLQRVPARDRGRLSLTGARQHARSRRREPPIGLCRQSRPPRTSSSVQVWKRCGRDRSPWHSLSPAPVRAIRTWVIPWRALRLQRIASTSCCLW